MMYLAVTDVVKIMVATDGMRKLAPYRYGEEIIAN